MGVAGKTPSGWVKRVQVEDPNCGVVRHESARLTQYALERQPEGQERTSRLQALPRTAMGVCLKQGRYACKNFRANWAETANFSFLKLLPSSLPANNSTLAKYDLEVA